MSKNIYWFKELSKESIPVAGGKGANLGEMINIGLPIPDGFCVSAQAFHHFIESNSLEQVISDHTASLDVNDSQALQAASDAIKQAIMAGRIPGDIRSDIVRSYNKLCGVDLIPAIDQEKLVAVRSSATAEDLPEASFAGQQATFLNVHGAEDLVKAVKACWASLFEARAIYYRNENNFEHLKVGLSAIVQLMVQSESSGIMFTVDPISQERDKLVVEAGFGLGEAIVSGEITPDHYVVSKDSMDILDRQVSHQDRMIVLTEQGNEWLEVPEELRESRKISDEQLLELAALGKRIEEHYGRPQDIEWAIDREGMFIVQSRAITTLKKVTAQSAPASVAASSMDLFNQPAQSVSSDSTASLEMPSFNVVRHGHEDESIKEVKSVSNETALAAAAPVAAANAAVLLQGMGASPGIASGPVRLVHDPKEIYRVKKGDVLVTEMTTPDFVPAMKRAAAIITNEGGSTCHAAIVSRELGIPCIVGTRTATQELTENQIVTVDAKRGVVYDGAVQLEQEHNEAASTGSAGGASASSPITGTKVYVNLAEPELADIVAAKDVDGVGLLRAEFMIAGLGKHPKALLKQGRGDEFVEALARGLRKVCAAFYPRPVIYRATDFKTNEYKNLEGGAEFEPHEENPMIGFRGCFRYIKDPEVFNLELEAIKKVREQYGMKNLHLMIPVVRTVHEFKLVKKLTEEAGLYKSRDFKLGIMCEVPSTVILAEEFCKAGADFFSIGSNDLTQLTLGIDRDNPIVAEEFDERDPAIYESIRRVIESCHKYGVKVGICGQAPSVYPEFAEKLVEYGIDSISGNPDVINSLRRSIASAEMRVLLKRSADSARQ